MICASVIIVACLGAFATAKIDEPTIGGRQEYRQPSDLSVIFRLQTGGYGSYVGGFHLATYRRAGCEADRPGRIN
jgi:hypothetical protein